MEESRVRAALEAILFTTGKAVKLSDIAKALDLETDAVREAAVSLKEQYELPDRREDPAYSGWNNDYELYRAHRDKLMK